jgi:serine O-acetyltransferase
MEISTDHSEIPKVIEQSGRSYSTGIFELFKQDVQRWIVPGQFADPSHVTNGKIASLLFRHMQVRAMLLFRFGAWCNHKHIRFLPLFIQRLIALFYGLEIAIGQEVGGGLYIAHPYGTVIMPDRIGNNCSIVHNVTIGMRNESDFPSIGDNVFIGAGARVLGGVRIGDGAKIGANAVVIKDVPPGATMVGIPARQVRK